jgi:hypothetical protein
MASTFTPSTPITGPWAIDREDCIGDSLGYLNANTNFFGVRVNSLSADLDNKFDKTGGTITGSLTATGNIFTPNRPMFSAQQVPYSGTSTTYIGQIIPGNNTYVGSNNGWDTLNLVNVGSGFNRTTGLFTAPVAGYYQLNFNQTIASGSNHFGDVYFRRNNDGARLSENLVLRGTTGWNAGALSIIVYMNVGDSVGTYIEGYTGAPNGIRGTQFSGYLIG